MSGGVWSGRRRRLLVILVAVLVLFLVLNQFFQLHRIDGASMWPSWIGYGSEREWVVVRRSSELPGRYDPVVIHPDATREETVLKRVVAFEGEVVYIEGGDVRIGDGFLPRSIEQIAATRVPVLHIGAVERAAFRRRFVLETGDAALSDDGQYLKLGAAGAPSRLVFPADERFRDDHVSAQGVAVPGENLVRDLMVTLAFHELAVGAEVTIEHHLDERLAASLALQRTATGIVAVLSAIGTPSVRRTLVAHEREIFRLVLVDGRAVLLSGPDGAQLVVVSALERRTIAALEKSFLALRTGAEPVIFSRLDIDRDIHYTSTQSDARYGVTEPLPLSKRQVFVLGDNSPQSRDSRRWGALETEWVVGRPVFVIWPPSRVRLVSSR